MTAGLVSSGNSERGVGSNALQRIGDIPFVIVLIIDALEIGCVIRIASAFVSRYLRIGAEGASPFDTLRRIVVVVLRRDDLLGSDPFFDPLLKRGQRIEGGWPSTAAAMRHSRHQEQAVEILGLFQRLMRTQRPGLKPEVPRLVCNHANVIIDAVERGNVGIVEPMIMDQFAAPMLQWLEVRVNRVESRGQRLVRQNLLVVDEVQIGRSPLESVEIPIRVVVHEILEERKAQRAVDAAIGRCARDQARPIGCLSF